MEDVYQAYWHDDACVKMLHLASPTNGQLFQSSVVKSFAHFNPVNVEMYWPDLLLSQPGGTNYCVYNLSFCMYTYETMIF